MPAAWSSSGGSAVLRAALEPVYEALELEWDPATAGSVEDEVPGADARARSRRRSSPSSAVISSSSTAELDPETLALGAELEPAHVPLP